MNGYATTRHRKVVSVVIDFYYIIPLYCVLCLFLSISNCFPLYAHVINVPPPFNSPSCGLLRIKNLHRLEINRIGGVMVSMLALEYGRSWVRAPIGPNQTP